MAGPVHRYAVWPETGDTAVLGTVQPAVAAGIVGDDGPHALGAQVIGQGNGDINMIDDIFPGGIIKITVLHMVLRSFMAGLWFYCIKRGRERGRDRVVYF